MHELDKWHESLRWNLNKHLKRALTLKGEGQTSVAVTELLHARSRYPRSEGDAAFARTLTGMALSLEGRAREAIAELQGAIRLYPYLAAPHVAMAYSLLLEEQCGKAFEAYQHALCIDPYDSDLYLTLLRAFEQSGRIDDLFADCREVLPPEEKLPLSGPNPVELFLARQPSAARRNSCLQVLCELIQGKSIDFLRPSEWREMPDLVDVWMFLAATPDQLSLHLDLYCDSLINCGFAAATVRRRLNMALSFLELCSALGYVKSEERGLHYPWSVARDRTGRRGTTTPIGRYRSWRQAGG